MSNLEQNLKEILDRVTRLESRLVQLGDFVGANLRSKQRIEIEPPTAPSTPPTVHIDALDVSVSRIRTELRQRADYTGPADVYYQGRPIMRLL